MKGLALYDNTARMHDPILGRFHTPDPLFGNYPQHSPWTHCAANPLNLVDRNGLEWKKVRDNKGITYDYQRVDGDEARDTDGNLLPDVYEMAILFTATGENGRVFDPNSNQNIGSSIAIVFGKNAAGEIYTFESCTYPSDLTKYPTVPAGDYEAKVGLHRNSYTALRMGDIGTEDFSSNRINLGFHNPSQEEGIFYATGINIHKPGSYNSTGRPNGATISAGCLLIDLNKWDKFIGLFDRGIRIGITLER